MLTPPALFTVGTVIVLLTLFDVFSTTTSLASPGGPITSRTASTVWRVLHGPQRRRWRMQGGVGPIVLLSIIVTWVVLLWAGWTLIFASTPLGVVPASDTVFDSFRGRAYYAGFTVSTLGVGDFRPGSDLWRMLTVVAALSGLTLITQAVTFVLPVVTAVTHRRQQAATIALYGAGVQELADSAFDGETFSRLDAQFTSLAQGILLVAERHLAYPVLHYFHETERQVTWSVNVAAMDVTLAILSRTEAERAPNPIGVLAVRGAITRLLDVMEADFLRPQQREEPTVSPALVAGIDTTIDVDALRASEGERWTRLGAFVQQDGWRWDDVVGHSEPGRR